MRVYKKKTQMFSQAVPVHAHVLIYPNQECFACVTQVARLFLVSDILHNSTAPVRNASRYRGLLEDTLPDIFQSLQARLAAWLDLPCLLCML